MMQTASDRKPPGPPHRRGRRPFLSATFDLPRAPSTNNLFRNVRRGRVKTAKYQSWIETAGWELATQHPPKIAGSVAVTALVGLSKRRPDIDNGLKALIDLFVAHQVLDDDANVVEVFARLDKCVPSGRVHVTVRQTLAPALRMSAAGRESLSLQRRGVKRDGVLAWGKVA
jgi:Holliday junction resolvase RusA-like endonuclease